MAIITYSSCPICQSSGIQNKLEAEDYTVSHQNFEIWECGNCLLRFTQHIPSAKDIDAYYQSDAYVSHTDTKEGIINKLYHFVRRRTLRQKRKLVQIITGLQKAVLLDIGAGTGAFSQEMTSAGWQVTGIEPDEATRARALQLNGIALKPAPALFELPLQSFDAITMWHVLEHVHGLHDYIEQIGNLLKPGGRVCIAVPNYTSYDAGVYQQYWAAYDVPRHLYHFSPKSVDTLLALHGMRVIKIQPMWFDSFYISMLSEQYKNGRNNLIKAVWNGLLSNIRATGNHEKCSSVIYIIEKAN